MDKTININLGGILFQIDEEAFRILRDYLQAINNRFSNSQGGHETIEDIESRIAEIFQTQKGLAGVVSKENVESMIAIIGKPEDFDPGEPEAGAPVFTNQKKKMYRNTDDIIVGGVCSGMAAYLDSDPVLFRILFVIFAVFFGVGVVVYIGLWIALPAARTESQKRTMYGNDNHPNRSLIRNYDNTQISGASGYSNDSTVGNAINEVFRALGKVGYIILRIILIVTGISLVLTGFLFILCYVMIFIFKFPGVFSIDSSGVNLIYVFDFLKYIVNPAAVPWIIILGSIAFILPMLALIYWGVKMIFWFNARDGVVSLVALVIWVMSFAALSIIGFNEGISFAQTGKSTVETVLPESPDTLYVITDRKIADLKYNKQISLPHEEYSLFLNDDKKELYIRPYLSVDRSENKVARVEVRKRATGRTYLEAAGKAEALIYNYTFKNNSLNIDEYFTVPSGRKWSADEIGIHLYIPTGTILKFDEYSRILVHSHFRDGDEDYLESKWESGTGNWVMTEDGLEPMHDKIITRK
jgi:phage shock protein PspC (stress-responsive transcriptional regulator)